MVLKEGTFIKSKYKTLFLCTLLSYIVYLMGANVDAIIGGMIMDDSVVAAIELVAPIDSILYFVSYLIAIGTSIIYSRKKGAFEEEESEEIAGTGLILTALLGIILAILLFVFRNFYFSFYDCTPEILDMAKKYYIGYILIALLFPLKSYLFYMISADGEDVLSFLGMLSYVVINISLSVVLIKTNGIFGLALSSFCAGIPMVLIYSIHFLRKNNGIRFRFVVRWDIMPEVIKVSSSDTLIMLYTAIIDIVLNIFVVANFGDRFLPAYAVVNLVIGINEFLYCGGEGAQSFIAVAFGEDNPFEFKRILKICNKWTLVMAIVLSAIVFVTAPVWNILYGITDPEVMAAAANTARIMAFTFIGVGYIETYTVVYPIIGKISLANILGILYMLICPAALAMPLGYLFGYNGLSLGFALVPYLTIIVWALAEKIRGENKEEALYGYPRKDDSIKEFNLDISVSEEAVVKLTEKVSEFLKDNDVSNSLINKVCMVMEDSLIYIKKENEGKTVLAESVLLLNDEHIKLIIKDNGKVFDLIQKADDSKDFSSYVMARMMDTANDKSNTTTISFNRNAFAWERA